MKPRSFARLITEWIPSARWASMLAPAYARLTSDPPLAEALASWSTLAMTFGDTRAPELCIVAAVYARRTIPEGGMTGPVAKLADRLRAHESLAQLDLGLAVPRTPGRPIPLASVQDAVVPRPTEWLDAFLVPFGGHLAEAAQVSLLLAAHRLGIVALVEPFGVVELRRWAARLPPPGGHCSS
jgi:hypothetical protein